MTNLGQHPLEIWIWRQAESSIRTHEGQPERGAAVSRVGTTKNQHGCVFPFDVLPELGDVMQAQRLVMSQVEQEQGRIVPWVFHRDGRQVKDCTYVWATACTAAWCPGRVPHDMRRSAARNLIRAGVSEKTAMILTGHKSRVVVDRYDIVNKDDLREAVRKLDASTVTKTVTIARSDTIA